MKPQYALFVAEYLKDPNNNATAAARAAGFSEKSAHTQGSRLLKRLDIQGAIAQARATKSKKPTDIIKRAELSAEKLTAALNDLVDFDPARMYDEDGNMLKIKDMDEATRKSIAGIEETFGLKGSQTKLRLSSRLGSIELAAKIMGVLRPQDVFAPVQIIIGEAPRSLQVSSEPSKPILPVWDEE